MRRAAALRRRAWRSIYQRPRTRGNRPYCLELRHYFVDVLPDELPVPVEPLLLPVLGELELGEVVLLEPPAALPVELPVEPLLLPDAPLEDLLKWASHSARETWPSLFLSTSEKLGCELDELELPPLAEGEDDEDEDGELEDEDGVLDEDDDEDGLLVEEPVELLPLDDDGEVAEGVLEDDDGLLEDDEDWATAKDDSANITAAAVTPRVLGMHFS